MSDRRTPPIAARMADIQPFHVMALLARARELEAAGRSIVHMEIGEPDFPTAAPIIAAGQAALAAGYTHYTPAVGLPVLRAAIATHYRVRYGVEIDPARIVVTPGASGALQLVLAALIDPGREVLMSDPGYPCNRTFVRLLEGRAVGVPTDAAHGYQLTAELARDYWTERTAAHAGRFTGESIRHAVIAGATYGSACVGARTWRGVDCRRDLSRSHL